DDGSLSEIQVQRAVKIFSEGARACDAAPKVYRVDCYQVVFGKTARIFGKASAYWEAEVALTRVSRSLFTFVRGHTDKNLGKEKINGSRIKAVTEASLPEAQTLYVAAVDKAAGVLRGGTAVENRYFEPMADAVEAVRDKLN
ncbi:hypothetical protein, partial [Roseobacter sp.]|uniref:hypothetical protein n=1 Tax=Roseobacter sp. TaxID=1907202 RepID=UPI0032994EE8